MPQRRRRISQSERVPRPSPSRQRPPRIPPTPLLVARRDAAAMLGGVSIATLIRMEAAGTLQPVRLNRQARTGQVFYRHDDLVRLAGGEG